MAITTQEKYASNQAITNLINAVMSKDTNSWAAMQWFSSELDKPPETAKKSQLTEEFEV